MYVVFPRIDVFIAAGLQVPVIAGLFVEEVGRAAGVAFKQYGPSCVKVGVTAGSTTIVIC